MATHAIVSRVILLNYLIAILVNAYNKYRSSGVFDYKCNLFAYSEHFMTALEDHTYGQLVIHPPPLNYVVFLFAVPMVLFKSMS